MKTEELIAEIVRFVAKAAGNCSPETGEPYFEPPLVRFAAADDPLFIAYKTIIGSYHLTPQEMFSATLGREDVMAATVISWVLPITPATRISNRREELHPSRAWSQTRSHGEQFNASLRRHMVEYLQKLGYKAVAPQLSPAWQELPDTPVGISSTWSERHAAYAAGHGTFSLNEGLITPIGIAHRCGSIVTDLPVAPSGRPYPDHRVNCLYFRNGSCGLCIARCPVGALSRQGHDKDRCRDYVYTELPQAIGQTYGVPNTGCGLCQTRVPCEQGIPQG